MDLQSWAVIFLKHQDLFKKEIKEVVEETNRIILKKKKDELWVLQEEFSVVPAQGIICLNTSANFKALFASWNDLLKTSTKIVFANPRTNERWMVVPAHHAWLADDKSFKAGLEAMFKSIAEY